MLYSRSTNCAPLTSIIARAENSEIGWLKGSFAASISLICLISFSPLIANAPVEMISMAIPTITSHSPQLSSDLDFSLNDGCFPACFSVRRPMKMIMPPTQATTAMQTSQNNQELDMDNWSDAKVILICSIPYMVWGKLVLGNTWKQAVYFTLFGAVVGITAAFVICLFL